MNLVWWPAFKQHSPQSAAEAPQTSCTADSPTYCQETEPARTQDKEAKEYRSIDYCIQFLQQHHKQQQRARARQRLRSQASLRKSLEQRWLSSANELTQACRSSGGSFFFLLIKWEIVGVACGSLLLTCLELMKHKFQCILFSLLFYIFNEIRCFFSSLL